MFIDPTNRQSVSDDAGNTIWYKPRMDVATKAAVQDELLSIRVDSQRMAEQAQAAMSNGQNDEPASPAGARNNDMSVHVGIERRKLALLKHNIVDWDGPAFMRPVTDARGDVKLDSDGEPIMRKVPCTGKWIERLDPDEPLIQEVLERIGEGNAPALAKAKTEAEAGN